MIHMRMRIHNGGSKGNESLLEELLLIVHGVKQASVVSQLG